MLTHSREHASYCIAVKRAYLGLRAVVAPGSSYFAKVNCVAVDLDGSLSASVFHADAGYIRAQSHSGWAHLSDFASGATPGGWSNFGTVASAEIPRKSLF